MFSWVREPFFKVIHNDVVSRMKLKETKVLSENQHLNTCVIQGDKSSKPSDRRAVKKFLLTQGDINAATTSWAYFKNEVTFLQSLKHPNIVKMTAAFSCPTYLAIVMDCASSDLHCNLVDLAPERSREIITQLVDAVCFLHARRVVHGNTTLKKVLYFPRDGTVKLCNFSRAQAITDDTNRPMTWLFSEGYQPPEMNKSQCWDAFKMESYTLGVLCYAVLTKEYPESGMDYLLSLFCFCQSIEEEYQIFLRHLLSECPIQRQTVTQARHALAKRKKPEPNSVPCS